VRMPGPSGLDAVRQLRAAGFSTPVVLMTAFPERSVVLQAEGLGVPLLAKPFRIRELLDAVLWGVLTREVPAPTLSFDGRASLTAAETENDP